MSTYKQKFLKQYKLDDIGYSLNELSKITKIKKSILQEVYNRGIGAWKTNITSVRLKNTFEKNLDIKKYPRNKRLTKEQWANSRVYSFIMKGKTYYSADKDLANKIL